MILPYHVAVPAVCYNGFMERDVLFTDPEGHKVAGILASPSQDTDRIALLCHGFLSNKNSNTNRALTAMLVPEGIATFRFDFFGQGESEGPFERITTGVAVRQGLAAMDLIASWGYSSLALVGSSFGGLVAILAAAQRPQLACLALKCPVTDFPAMLRGEFGEAGMAQWKATGTIPNVAGGAGRIRLPYAFYEDCLRHIAYAPAKAITAPTLIVHGDADEYVPVHQSRRLLESLGGPKRLAILPGADHHFSRPPDFREMTRLIAQWVRDHLT